MRSLEAAARARVDIVSARRALLEAAAFLGVEDGAAPALVPRAGQQAPIVVMVDLGNVHDCLQQLLPLAAAGEIELRAYADLMFNGFGVSPPLASPGCTVFKSASPQKNAADTQLIWDCAQLCTAAEKPLQILVATKDNGFRHLKELAEGAGAAALLAPPARHQLYFAHDWATLQALLTAGA